LDGRARLEAFRRLEVSHIPAIENFSLASISSGVGKMVQTGREAAELTKFVAKNYAVPIAKSAKEGFESLEKDARAE
jgi:hypothetical protein